MTAVPAVYHHRLVLSGPFGPNQSHKVQEISGVIRNAVVWPRQVLDLRKLSLLFTLNTHTHTQREQKKTHLALENLFQKGFFNI